MLRMCNQCEVLYTEDEAVKETINLTWEYQAEGPSVYGVEEKCPNCGYTNYQEIDSLLVDDRINEYLYYQDGGGAMGFREWYNSTYEDPVDVWFEEAAEYHDYKFPEQNTTRSSQSSEYHSSPQGIQSGKDVGRWLGQIHQG